MSENAQTDNTQAENTQNDIEIEPLSDKEMDTVSGGSEQTGETIGESSLCSWIGCS